MLEEDEGAGKLPRCSAVPLEIAAGNEVPPAVSHRHPKAGGAARSVHCPRCGRWTLAAIVIGVSWSVFLLLLLVATVWPG